MMKARYYVLVLVLLFFRGIVIEAAKKKTELKKLSEQFAANLDKASEDIY